MRAARSPRRTDANIVREVVSQSGGLLPKRPQCLRSSSKFSASLSSPKTCPKSRSDTNQPNTEALRVSIDVPAIRRGSYRLVSVSTFGQFVPIRAQGGVRINFADSCPEVRPAWSVLVTRKAMSLCRRGHAMPARETKVYARLFSFFAIALNRLLLMRHDVFSAAVSCFFKDGYASRGSTVTSAYA